MTPPSFSPFLPATQSLTFSKALGALDSCHLMTKPGNLPGVATEWPLLGPWCGQEVCSIEGRTEQEG